MKRTILIRLGGVAVMVSGVAWVVGTLWQWLDIVSLVLLVLGTIAAVAALHLLQREHYGLQGTLFSLMAFIGLTMILVFQVSNFMVTGPEMDLPPLLDALGLLLAPGLLVASIGTIGLGVVTIAARVLPWWCGVALIASSPLALLLEFALLNSLLWELWPVAPNQPVSNIGPDTISWMALGVPWVLVGYAIFRAGSRLPGQPSQVR